MADQPFDAASEELFIRAGKRLQPTPNAHRLAAHARGIMNQVRQIEQEFENDPDKDTRPFRFATGATTLIHRLGPPLRLLKKVGTISYSLYLWQQPFLRHDLTWTSTFPWSLGFALIAGEAAAVACAGGRRPQNSW